MKRIGLLLVTLPAAHFVVNGQTPDATLFESKIRPVLAKSCYGCHSSKMKAPMGGLVLDTKAGLAQGGVSGPVVVPGKPAQSKLLTALRYTDPHLQMPPSGKLAAPVLEGFEQWIAAGAVDPRVDAPATAATTPLKGMSVELGRKWWSFQPLSELRAPPVNRPLPARQAGREEAGSLAAGRGTDAGAARLHRLARLSADV
jgi:hypothetical protein